MCVATVHPLAFLLEDMILKLIVYYSNTLNFGVSWYIYISTSCHIMTVTAGNFWSVLTTNLKLQNEFSCRKILESSTFHTTFQANKKHWQHIAGSLRSVTPQWAPKTRLWCVWGDISADGNPSGYRKLPPAMVQVQIWDPKGSKVAVFSGVFWGSFFTFENIPSQVRSSTPHKKTSQVERIYATHIIL